MRLVNIDACDREQFYKECGGKDSLITVEAAFNMLQMLPVQKTGVTETSEELVHVETLCQVMWERDVAIEQLKELGYEFGQKIEYCDDAISRNMALNEAYKVNIDGEIFEVVQVETLLGLPPVSISISGRIKSLLNRMWNCRGKKTSQIDKVKMETLIREELGTTK